MKKKVDETSRFVCAGHCSSLASSVRGMNERCYLKISPLDGSTLHAVPFFFLLRKTAAGVALRVAPLCKGLSGRDGTIPSGSPQTDLAAGARGDIDFPPLHPASSAGGVSPSGADAVRLPASHPPPAPSPHTPPRLQKLLKLMKTRCIIEG